MPSRTRRWGVGGYWPSLVLAVCTFVLVAIGVWLVYPRAIPPVPNSWSVGFTTPVQLKSMMVDLAGVDATSEYVLRLNTFPLGQLPTSDMEVSVSVPVGTSIACETPCPSHSQLTTTEGT